MTTSAATAAGASGQTPIAQAIGEIHDHRVTVLTEYKKTQAY